MEVEIFATVQSVGYLIEVLTGYDQPMNRYAFLLVELNFVTEKYLRNMEMPDRL